jgi:uncharacterized membrane protein YphA (DoxX/SURF4 family)
MLQQEFNRVDVRLTQWMARNGITLLRISVGIVFFWFGVLKFLPGLSPAQDLAARTIETLSFGLVQPSLSLPVLAAWECLIGLGMISGRFMRATILLLLLQMAGTITPLFLFPKETFTVFPIAPTLEGQYIVKNLVLISAALVIGATVRGGAVIADPKAAETARKLEERAYVQ